MRLTLNELEASIQTFVDSLSMRNIESLRIQLSDDPKQFSEKLRDFDSTKLSFKSRRRKDFQRLAILSWFIPFEEIRVLLQLNLKETWDKADKFNEEKEVLLTSKAFALAWVLLEANWSERDFFGNILNEKTCQGLLSSLFFEKVSKRKVKRYTGYCRGYRESNRRAPNAPLGNLSPKCISVPDYEKKMQQFEARVFFLSRKLEDYLELCG